MSCCRPGVLPLDTSRRVVRLSWAWQSPYVRPNPPHTCTPAPLPTVCVWWGGRRKWPDHFSDLDSMASDGQPAAAGAALRRAHDVYLSTLSAAMPDMSFSSSDEDDDADGLPVVALRRPNNNTANIGTAAVAGGDAEIPASGAAADAVARKHSPSPTSPSRQPSSQARSAARASTAAVSCAGTQRAQVPLRQTAADAGGLRLLPAAASFH